MKSYFGDDTIYVKITTKPCFPGHGACLFAIQSSWLLKNLGETARLSGREDPCWAKTWLGPLALPPKRRGSIWTVLIPGSVFWSWGRKTWSASAGTGYPTYLTLGWGWFSPSLHPCQPTEWRWGIRVFTFGQAVLFLEDYPHFLQALEGSVRWHC